MSTLLITSVTAGILMIGVSLGVVLGSFLATLGGQSEREESDSRYHALALAVESIHASQAEYLEWRIRLHDRIDATDDTVREGMMRTARAVDQLYGQHGTLVAAQMCARDALRHEGACILDHDGRLAALESRMGVIDYTGLFTLPEPVLMNGE